MGCDKCQLLKVYKENAALWKTAALEMMERLGKTQVARARSRGPRSEEDALEMAERGAIMDDAEGLSIQAVNTKHSSNE